MSERWPRVKLGEVLTQVEREVTVDPTAQYRGAGVLSYAKGLFTKGTFYGSETAYPVMYRVKAGDFVYSRLFAWEGAFALADESFDGVVMSQEFPMFNVDSSRLDPRWLLLNVGREQFWKSLGSAGLGQRRKRVQPESLLASEIPLPPIEVQREVAEKVVDYQRAIGRIRDAVTARNASLSSVRMRWQPAIQRQVSSAKLAEIAEISGGMTPSTGNPVYWSDGTIAWVTPKDIKAVVVDRSEDKVTQAALDESRLVLHPRDSIVVVTRGMILARYVPIAMLGLEATVNQDVKVIRLKESAPVSAAFLLWWMRGQERGIHVKVLRSTHDTRRLETRVLEDLLVPLYSEEEQNRFVSRCQRVEALHGQLDGLIAAQERDFTALDKSIYALCEEPRGEHADRG